MFANNIKVFILYTNRLIRFEDRKKCKKGTRISSLNILGNDVYCPSIFYVLNYFLLICLPAATKMLSTM